MEKGHESRKGGRERAGATYHQFLVILNLRFCPLGLLAVGDVVCNGAAEQVGALAHQGDLLVEDGGWEGLREAKEEGER